MQKVIQIVLLYLKNFVFLKVNIQNSTLDICVKIKI
jgi:hypothetical protein